MTSQYFDMVKFFWRCFVSLGKFSYWSKFHANIISGSGVMTIYFYKGLTRNSGIGNTPVWVLPNIWRLERVRITKFDTDISDEMLLNAKKHQGYGFYYLFIKGQPTGGGNYPPPLLGLICQKMRWQSDKIYLAWLKSVHILWHNLWRHSLVNKQL